MRKKEWVSHGLLQGIFNIHKIENWLYEEIKHTKLQMFSIGKVIGS